MKPPVAQTPPPPYNSVRTAHLKAYEAQFKAAQLSEFDFPWLTDLANPDIEINTDWIEATRELVVIGSISLRDGQTAILPEEITDARKQFWGIALGWSDARSKHHQTYQYLQTTSKTMLPIATFIGTQRSLYRRGVNNSSVLIGNTAILTKSEKSAEAHLDGLAELGYDEVALANSNPWVITITTAKIRAATTELIEAGRDPLKVAANEPSVLTSPAKRREILGRGRQNRKRDSLSLSSKESTSIEYGKSRMVIARRVAQTLGWQDDIAKVVAESEKFMSAPEAKLRFHAKLFARHGTASMTATEVAALIDLPPNAHLGTFILGMAYTAEHVEAVRDMLSSGNPYQEVKRVKDTLANQPKLEALVGTRVLRTYNQFLNPRAH